MHKTEVKGRCIHTHWYCFVSEGCVQYKSPRWTNKTLFEQNDIPCVFIRALILKTTSQNLPILIKK